MNLIFYANKRSRSLPWFGVRPTYNKTRVFLPTPAPLIFKIPINWTLPPPLFFWTEMRVYIPHDCRLTICDICGAKKA